MRSDVFRMKMLKNEKKEERKNRQKMINFNGIPNCAPKR